MTEAARSECYKLRTHPLLLALKREEGGLEPKECIWSLEAGKDKTFCLRASKKEGSCRYLDFSLDF